MVDTRLFFNYLLKIFSFLVELAWWNVFSWQKWKLLGTEFISILSFFGPDSERLLALVSMKSQLLENKNRGGGESLRSSCCNVLAYRCDKPVKIQWLRRSLIWECNRSRPRNHALRGSWTIPPCPKEAWACISPMETFCLGDQGAPYQVRLHFWLPLWLFTSMWKIDSYELTSLVSKTVNGQPQKKTHST